MSNAQHATIWHGAKPRHLAQNRPHLEETPQVGVEDVIRGFDVSEGRKGWRRKHQG